MSDVHDTAPASGRVVVVEDDPLQAESLAFILRQEGYVVELASTGAEALAVARSQPAPDTVLLDVALPDLSGVEVARRLRAGSNVPIIMLTARRNEIDKITGLDAGADDYVTKPFSHAELLARIRVQIRRGPVSTVGSDLEHGVYKIGGLRIDTGMRRLARDERVIDLSAREFDIIRLLAEAAGRVVERQQLFANVWGPEFFGDERALDVYVRMIRKKIKPDPSRPIYLHTVRGVGYRLAEEQSPGHVLKNPLRTLRGRLATTYACLAVLGVATSALYTASTVRNGLHDRVVLDLADEARLMAQDVSGSLARGDSVAANDYVLRAETLTHARLVIVDRSGNVVAGTSGWPTADDDGSMAAALVGATTVDPQADDPLRPGSDMVQVSLPIATADGNVVGALEASYSLDEVEATLSRLNLTSLLLATGAVLVAALAGLFLATSVARPAGHVAQAALALANRRPAGLPFGPQSATAFPPRLPEPRGSTDEIRTLVQAFNSLADQLQVHEQARREFASDVSHELHSLASAMQTAAEALERGASEANPALGQRLVLGLVSHTRRLVRLADDLLELARWEGGRLSVDAQEMDLAELIRGTLDEWTPEARRREISLQVRLPVGPLPLTGDPIRLTQALGNLIENALKYAGTNGWVHVDLGPPLVGSYELAVTDSGPGIPLQVLPRVFERYFRVEGRASGGPGGMGLGLAIARAIVLAHGGELTAESPRGSGARFVLRLPVPPSANGPARPLGNPAGLRVKAALPE